MKPVALEIEESATVEASTTVSVQDLARATAEKQAIPAIIAVDHPSTVFLSHI